MHTTYVEHIVDILKRQEIRCVLCGWRVVNRRSKYLPVIGITRRQQTANCFLEGMAVISVPQRIIHSIIHLNTVIETLDPGRVRQVIIDSKTTCPDALTPLMDTLARKR